MYITRDYSFNLQFKIGITYKPTQFCADVDGCWQVVVANGYNFYG